MDTSDWTIGTVRYVELEGGFYGIEAEDGSHLDPINLADEFEEDGLEIRFRFEERTDLMGFHQWGKIVEITEVERVGE